jgi:flagellar hook-length control protein FliK
MPVAEQLASVVLPAARQSDGNYQVNIRLQPAELGVVHIALRLESGTVNLSMHAEGGATGDLLRQNLGQLRQQLSTAGFNTGTFDVSTGGGNGTGQAPPDTPHPYRAPWAAASTAVTDLPQVGTERPQLVHAGGSDALLDVRL